MIKVFIKDFYTLEYLDYLLNEINELKLYEDKTDGIIFTKVNYPYVPGKNSCILKWKPDYLNTIDFLVVENTEMN